MFQGHCNLLPSYHGGLGSRALAPMKHVESQSANKFMVAWLARLSGRLVVAGLQPHDKTTHLEKNEVKDENKVEVK